MHISISAPVYLLIIYEKNIVVKVVLQMMYHAPARRYSLAPRCHDLINEINIPAEEIDRMGPQSGSWSIN